MINPHNVVNILTNLISERLTLISTSSSTRRDEEVAKALFKNVESVLNCSAYCLENNHTLDLDTELLEQQLESNDNNDNLYYNDEREKENIIQHQFSFEYMKNVIEFYDEKDEKTGKRKNPFSYIQKRFKKHPSCVLNTDQSGLQLEMFSKHTLSYQGEKFTLATVRSINNTTYPYTVQTIISMIGTLVGPLFLCLKEPSGR
ncbi:unnamed protein product [Rotaria sp. Silwood1]|nr:unnamed protein product [Rotaria sp. Silwood1]CAF3691745.1 unnamed protein product [Rotaria sp. Silwood1]CAF4734225.1 unnamed protein product [Rotaria sp. Silwood1]CAF4889821.1 unnamed protein product [Rotaria sp. Silwood1]